MLRLLGRNSGQALIQVIAVVAGMGMLFYLISDVTGRHRSQVVANADQTQLRLALQSTADYAIYGLKQRWCFSPNLVKDEGCNLNHPASTDRLMMSTEGVQYVRQMLVDFPTMISYPVEQLILTNFERTVDISDLTTAHPLFVVLQGLKSKGVTAVQVRFERDQSATIPRSGSEVYIHVYVTLLAKGEKIKTLAKHVSVHPREVGSFAFLTPGNLRMDKNYKEQPAPGDAVFHQFANADEVQGPGLIFMSPVFVNRDMFVPFSPDRSSSSLAYTPVTFADRVILGGGRVFEKDHPYSPKKAGAEDEKGWVDNRTFGGLQRGLENDGARDRGLDAFIATGAGGSGGPDEDLMSQCIGYYLKRSSINLLRDSSLFVTPRADNTTESSTYTLGLTEVNELNPQYSTREAIDFGPSWAPTWKNADIIGHPPDVSGQIFSLEVSAGSSRKGDIYLRPGSVVKFKVPSWKRVETKKIVSYKVKEGTPPNEKEVTKEKEVTEIEYEPMETTVTVSLRNITIDSYVQNDKAELKIDIDDPGGIGSKTNPSNLSFKLTAYDLTSYYSKWVEKYPNYKLLANLEYEFDKDTYQYSPPTQLKKVLPKEEEGQLVTAVDPGTNNAKLVDDCAKAHGTTPDGPAFGTASWDTSFADVTRKSWNFAGSDVPADPLVGTLDLDAKNSKAGANPVFQVISIAKVCRIHDSADFVAGFFSCDTLQIDSRTTPLRIIGTIIAAKVEIHPDAYKAGINWSTIYHPQATYELRAQKILKRRSDPNTPCNDDMGTTTPLWHPIPSIIDVADRYSCNVISLRARAKPFQWTAVDPDCGKPPGKSNTICKNQMVHFTVVDHAEEVQ